jgi:hypothetical protein
MDKFPYILVPNSIKQFLDKIQSTGIPNKLTYDYLGTIGFKSSNHRSLIQIMKSLGFITSDGVPTERWKRYRDKNAAKQVLSEGIKECYSDLFQLYPDAHLKDIDTLTNYFKSKTSVGNRAVSAMVQTFKILSEMAELLPIDMQESEELQIKSSRQPQLHMDKEKEMRQDLIININIQITLPETSNIETYDAIFAAMKRHFYYK